MNQIIEGYIADIKVRIESPENYAETVFPNITKGIFRGNPDVHIVIHQSADSVQFHPEYFSGGNFQYTRDSFFFKHPNFIASAKGTFSQSSDCIVDVAPKKPAGLIGHLRYIALATYVSWQQRKIIKPKDLQLFPISVMSYSLFWFVLHCALLKKNASFIHAATVIVDNRALLLAGTGGCGKTSVLFNLLEDENYKYLSEDFSIVTGTGEAVLCSKTLSIYASDLRGEPQLLMNYLRKLKKAEQKYWNKCRKGGSGNPMHKVPIIDVLDTSNIGQKANIGAGIFLVRRVCKKITFEKIDVLEFVERCVDASFRELKTLSEIAAQGRAVSGADSELPTIEKIRNSMSGIYSSSFANVPCYVLSIPEETLPSELTKVIKENLWF